MTLWKLAKTMTPRKLLRDFCSRIVTSFTFTNVVLVLHGQRSQFDPFVLLRSVRSGLFISMDRCIIPLLT